MRGEFTMLNSIFSFLLHDEGRPVAPVNMQAAGQLELYFTIGCLIVLVAVIAFMVYHWKKTKSPMGLLMLGGGIIAILTEVIYDLVGYVWFPTHGSIFTVFNCFGVSLPLWVAIGYSWFTGGGSFFAYSQFEKGVTAKKVVILYLIFMIADIILECTGCSIGTYIYYGNQPFRLFGFPMWWGISNGLNPVVIGFVVYMLKPYLKGVRSLLILWIVPCTAVAVVTFTTWIVWLPLGRQDSSLVTHIASIIVFITTWLFLYVIAKVAPKFSPREKYVEAVKCLK